jgi:tRNA-splicing ligase RtcB (3'-phosphate/5'-hydroxy nucleic acid ligase)
MAVKLDVPKKAIEDRIEPMLQDIAANVSFGLGRTNKEKADHEVFDSPLWQKSDVVGRLKSMAREQFGTVGSGNHYVDLFEDEEGFVWIGVHFGSRGLGHKTATGFLKLAGGREGIPRGVGPGP